MRQSGTGRLIKRVRPVLVSLGRLEPFPLLMESERLIFAGPLESKLGPERSAWTRLGDHMTRVSLIKSTNNGSMFLNATTQKSRKTRKRRENVKRRDPIKSSGKILLSGMSHFARYGLEGARVVDIIKEAGLSHRMLYHYYENKEALYLATLEFAYKQ